MLEPFVAISYEPSVTVHWADAKGVLVLCWSILAATEMRSVVIRANRSLQSAFNRHLSGETFDADIGETLDLARQLHHHIHRRESPDAVQSAFNALGGAFFDTVEASLDEHLEEK